MLSGLNLPIKFSLQKQAFISLPWQASSQWQMWQIKKLCDPGRYQCEWPVRKVISLAPLTIALEKKKSFYYWVLKQASIKLTLKYIYGPIFFRTGCVKNKQPWLIDAVIDPVPKLQLNYVSVPVTCISAHRKFHSLWSLACRSSHTANIQCLARAVLFS